jgi:hypothetical protein
VTGSSGRGVLAPPPDLEVPRSARPTHAIDGGRRSSTLNLLSSSCGVWAAVRAATRAAGCRAMDGLRLAVEIKPVNLAVDRAIWNRFGDVRAFAVNILAAEAEAQSAAEEADEADDDSDVHPLPPGQEDIDEGSEVEELAGGELYRRSTGDLINRLVKRLTRTRRRETEGL